MDKYICTTGLMTVFTSPDKRAAICCKTIQDSILGDGDEFATQALALSIKDLLLMRLTGANIRPVNGSFGVAMSTKFSEDVVPLTDLKTNPGRVMKHVSDAHRPVLLTSRGRGVAVVQSVADYEQTEEERAFMRAVVEGLMDLEAGREVSITKARKRLGLK